MFSTVAFTLVVLSALGLASMHTSSVFIHTLVVVAAITKRAQLVQSRRVIGHG